MKPTPLVLLLAFVALLLCVPALEDALGRQLVFAIFFSLIVAASLFTGAARRLDMIAGGVVGALAVGLAWISIVKEPPPFGPYPLLVFALFLAITARSLVTRLLTTGEVGRAEIEISLCVYFIFGYFFAVVFTFLSEVSPGSFSGGADSLSMSESIYFSFVTLTTLGYGDITPISPLAQRFAVLEAIVGQIYLVVLVARLVSMHVARRPR